MLAVYATAGSASSHDEEVRQNLGVLTVQESKAIFDIIQLRTADCMAERGFEYKPNPWRGSDVRLSNVAPPPSPNDAALAKMDPTQRTAWETALLGERPVPGERNPARTYFEIPGGRMSVDLNSCASKGRSTAYENEIEWMKALAEAESSDDGPGGEDARHKFTRLQKEAASRATT